VFAPEVLVPVAQRHDVASITDHRVDVQLGRDRGVDLAGKVAAKSFPYPFGKAQYCGSVTDMAFLPEVQQEIDKVERYPSLLRASLRVAAEGAIR